VLHLIRYGSDASNDSNWSARTNSWEKMHLMTCMETPESVAADLAFSALFFVWMFINSSWKEIAILTTTK
jgi:hypothetical protein